MEQTFKNLASTLVQKLFNKRMVFRHSRAMLETYSKLLRNKWTGETENYKAAREKWSSAHIMTNFDFFSSIETHKKYLL
jgi:hypothetical protein